MKEINQRFEIRIEGECLVISKNRNSYKKDLIIIGVTLLIFSALMLIVIQVDFGPDAIFFLPFALIPVFVILFPAVMGTIRVILYGEELIFDKKTGEFKINNYLQASISEISKVEFHHWDHDIILPTFMYVVAIVQRLN